MSQSQICLSLPGGTQPPVEGWHKAQVVPVPAFDLNLLLHISQNAHLQANQEQPEQECLCQPPHLSYEKNWKLLLKPGLKTLFTQQYSLL